jgi:multiple sugar transport system substrate-binding protein
MKKRIGLLVLLAVVFFGTSLFAGGGKGDTAGSASGKTTIRAFYWGDTKRFELYRSILDQFEAANPDVSVNMETASWADFWDKLSVQTGGKNVPDFMGMHVQYAADYLPKGVCEVLDPYVADGTLDLSEWSQSAIDTGKYDGKLYMMAMGVGFQSLFFNTQLFKEVGVDLPPFDWTFDDAKVIGAKVRAALDKQGKTTTWMLEDMSTSLNSWRYFVRAHGREIYDAKGNINFLPSDAEEWFTLYKEFRTMGIIPDPATVTEYNNTTLENSLFGKDKVMTRTIPVHQFKLYTTTFPNKQLVIQRNPGYKGTRNGEFPEGSSWAASGMTTPEKKKAAVRLINFWENDIRSQSRFLLDMGFAGNQRMGREIMSFLTPAELEVVKFINTMMPVTTATPNPPSGASEIDGLFTNIAEQVRFDRKTPAAAAKEFYDEALAIRARAVARQQ